MDRRDPAEKDIKKELQEILQLPEFSIILP
jgi:hypothetical protein